MRTLPQPGYPLAPVMFSTDGSQAWNARAVARIYPGLAPPQNFNLKSFTIDKNCHGATNTASFVVSYAGNPDWTKLLFRGNPAIVPDNLPIYVEIWAGFPQNPTPDPALTGLTRRFYGIVDIYNPDNMATTEFHLRSIAAPLCTDKITTAIQNMTTVQFLRQTAAQYKIKTNVDSTLTNPLTLARVYAQDFVVGLKNLIKWDVLLRSSVFDDVDVWEDDGVLNYVHPWRVARKTIKLTYGKNVKSFKPSHSPQFNRNIEVFIHSYTDKIRTSTTTSIKTALASLVPGIDVTTSTKVSTSTPVFGTKDLTTTTYYSNGTVKVTKTHSSGGGQEGSNTAISESGKERYERWIPNLTSTECQNLAKAVWRQLSMHEYQGEFVLTMRPDILGLVGVTSLLDFSGYGMSAFNTLYWPRTMHEEFVGPEPGSNEAGGWMVTFNAVNHTLPLGGV